MNKSELKKNIGTTVKLLPKPTLDNKPLSDSRNKWLVLSELEDAKGLLFQNVIMDHEFSLGYDNIREYRSPDLLILRGQLVMKNDAAVSFEPFTDSPETDETDESSAFMDKRLKLAEEELQRLTPAEKAGLHELLVREKMTDTDISRFLESKGYGPYDLFHTHVSHKTSFLDREFSGLNTIIPAFRPILMKLLDQ